MYALERGEVEQRIIEHCIRERQPLPPAIANAPEIISGLEIFYIAFTELSSCRIMGMGEGPIPWTAINEYTQVYNFAGEQREDLFYIVRHMDLTYLRHKSAKYDKDKGNKEAAGGIGDKRVRKTDSNPRKAGPG